MEEGEKKPEAGMISGIPQKKIVYAVIAVAVVILAVVLIAKFGYNTDLLNPEGGQMSLHQNLSYKVTTPLVQRVITPIPKLCPAGTTGCSGGCMNVSFDARNCGSCGNACNVAIGGFCSLGSCCYPRGDVTCDGVVCWTGLACCNGRCVPTG